MVHGSTEITISVQLKVLKGRRCFEVESVDKGPDRNFNFTSSITALPAGSIEGTIRLKDKIETRDGLFAVWAWTAGKKRESKDPNETLEESAKRFDWAMIVMIKIQRRRDSHAITLVPSPDMGSLSTVTMYIGGPSFKQALEDWNDRLAGDETQQCLAKIVTVDAKKMRNWVRWSS